MKKLALILATTVLSVGVVQAKEICFDKPTQLTFCPIADMSQTNGKKSRCRTTTVRLPHCFELPPKSLPRPHRPLPTPPIPCPKCLSELEKPQPSVWILPDKIDNVVIGVEKEAFDTIDKNAELIEINPILLVKPDLVREIRDDVQIDGQLRRNPDVIGKIQDKAQIDEQLKQKRLDSPLINTQKIVR